MKILIKRAYDTAAKSDGYRVLIDRLWPRGVSKEKAAIDLWVKDIAPSAALRSWFHAQPEKRFATFTKKYKQELTTQKSVIKDIRATLNKKKKVTLVTAVKDIEHSHVPTLRSVLF